MPPQASESGTLAGLGARLRRARERKGLTQTELARSSGIDNVSLSGFERGKRLPTAARLGTLAAALDVSADYLLGLPEADGTRRLIDVADECAVAALRIADRLAAAADDCRTGRGSRHDRRDGE